MELDAVRVLEQCARQCDLETWARFERCFRRRLVSGIVRALGRGGRRADRETVADHLQEVYCHLLDNGRHVLRRFRGREEAQAHAYLKRVAESVTLDRLRADAAAKRGRSLVETADDGVLEDGVADLGASPEARLVHRDTWARYWEECRQAVRSRNRARDLAILQLAVLEGWSSREIAAQLGGCLTVSAVDTILHRLRRRLAAQGIALPGRSRPAREVAEDVGWGGDRRG